MLSYASSLEVNLFLMSLETTYLDHAGTTPYPKSLTNKFAKEMNSHLFGNPHSHSPSSMLSTEYIETTRLQALRFFNADPAQFDLIFVANATAAIKLVAECISDYGRGRGGFWYGYHADAHTSLVGVRELAALGSNCFQDDQAIDRWLSNPNSVLPGMRQPCSETNGEAIGLLAFPGQSNMNGRRLPLSWPRRVPNSIYTLLDAAALVATSPLDLSDYSSAPDFTALSFYKIFGFPDLGALIVRKTAGHVLSQRRYFGGGTVDMVVNGGAGNESNKNWFARKTTSLHEALEEGTPAFHNTAALQIALDVHKELFGSMQNVSKHTATLAKLLYDQMSMLRHIDGSLVCQIHKDPSSRYGDSKTQGPTIAFNLRNGGGNLIGKSDFEALAILNNIQIRTGGLCNPGGIAGALDISPAQMRENFEEGVRCGNEVDEMHGKPTGVIRVSLGAMSNERDVRTFLEFLQLFVDGSVRGSQQLAILQPSIETAPKLDYVVKVVESPEMFVCPVASCQKSLYSREALSSHLSIHQKSRRPRRLWIFR
ncbi:hypothetical protein ACLMJK_002397 [Lecanora helva]